MALDGIRYLSFAGAGTSGYAYAGFLDALERSSEYDTWRRSLQGVSGTSAGALAALSVVLGLNANARARVLHEVLDVTVDTLDFALLARRYGVDDGTSFRTQIQQVLEMSGLSPTSTLGDLYRLLRVDFAVVCTDIATSTNVTLSSRTYPNVRVCDAIFASCCVPFLFTPMEIEGYVLVDGCLTANQPRVYDDASTLFVWTLTPPSPVAALGDLTWPGFLMRVLQCSMTTQHAQRETIRTQCAHIVLRNPLILNEASTSLLDLLISEDSRARMLHGAYIDTSNWLLARRLLPSVAAVVLTLASCASASSRGYEPESEAAPDR